jgi:hypothetical protein
MNSGNSNGDTHGNQSAFELQAGAGSTFRVEPARLAQSFARSRYSPVVGFTRTRVPCSMNSGTFTTTPFSSFAGFDEAV